MAFFTGCRCPNPECRDSRVHRIWVKGMELWECKKCGYRGRPQEFNEENQKVEK